MHDVLDKYAKQMLSAQSQPKCTGLIEILEDTEDDAHNAWLATQPEDDEIHSSFS